MDEGDELLRLNTALTDITTQEYAVEPELIADYIPPTLPNECIDEVVNRHPISQVDVSTVSIKTNRDTPLDGAANPVDISSLPIPYVVKESEERNIVGDAYREAEELLKTRDKDIPHPAAAQHYFLEKIGRSI